jgi:hypothetical protein
MPMKLVKKLMEMSGESLGVELKVEDQSKELCLLLISFRNFEVFLDDLKVEFSDWSGTPAYTHRTLKT